MPFKEDVEKILAEVVHPALQSHGGGVELLETDEKEGIVKVRLIGACYG
ncbi:MAG: NifU family protein [Planctomycetota bacterium]|nr:NifU family protein [Planctomycetota bacterium]